MKNELQFGSLCVHDPKGKETTRPHQLPIYATSAFEFESIDQGIRIFEGKEKGHVYGRYGNPTIETVADKIARLEAYGLNIETKGLMVSSGMAAISTVVMATLRAGDKILTQGNLYGGTTELFLKLFKPLGIEPVFVNLQDLSQAEDQLKGDPSIKMIYYETPANPTLACVDIEAICALAQKYGQITVADNTFCTPYLQQPIRFGTDYVIHSTTKYLNGHGNSIAGIIVGKDPQAMHDQVWGAMKLVGTNCNPFDAWLTNNGLKTLELRMDRHSANAMEVSQFLEKQTQVERVNYCGLPSHPDHQLAQKQMKAFGGMLSFELKGGLQTGIDFMNRIRFCTLAPTLGDVDTLIVHPASMSHLNVDKAVRESYGITDGLIRISVGIENAIDIINDLEQALAG